MHWNFGHRHRGCGGNHAHHHDHHDHYERHGDDHDDHHHRGRYDYEAHRRGPRRSGGPGRGGFGGFPFGFGGPGGGPGDWMGGQPPRADRGAVRYLILDAISEKARHGYEVIHAIEERSRNSYRPSPGVVYPTLQMLEDLGFARQVEAEGRKAYEITDAGKAELAANRESVDDFYERTGGHPFERFEADFGEIRQRIGVLMKTFKNAVWQGRLSSATLKKVLALLDETAAKLEAIFQSDDKDQAPKE